MRNNSSGSLLTDVDCKSACCCLQGGLQNYTTILFKYFLNAQKLKDSKNVFFESLNF